jgi:hypothetical protein
MSKETLRAFKGFSSDLSFDGLEELVDASSFVNSEGDLSLLGITRLSDVVAAQLLQRPGPVYLPYELVSTLETLSVPVALLLVKCNHGTSLHLLKIKTLTRDVAEALAKHEGSLYLNGLQELDADAAAALARHAGAMELNGLRSLSRETATSLSGFTYDLSRSLSVGMQSYPF